MTKPGGWVGYEIRTSRFDFGSGPDQDQTYQWDEKRKLFNLTEVSGLPSILFLLSLGWAVIVPCKRQRLGYGSSPYSVLSLMNSRTLSYDSDAGLFTTSLSVSPSPPPSPSPMRHCFYPLLAKRKAGLGIRVRVCVCVCFCIFVVRMPPWKNITSLESPKPLNGKNWNMAHCQVLPTRKQMLMMM